MIRQRAFLLPVVVLLLLLLMMMMEVVVVVYQPVHEPAGKVLWLAAARWGTGRAVFVV
jgi:hypothetical protein